MSIENIGAIAFGFVAGWITYRTLRRSTETVALSNIASVLAAIGGGAVVGLFHTQELFAYYSIGLLAGFLCYLVVAQLVPSNWLGG